MNEAKGKLEKQKKDYEEMVLRLESKEEEIQTQRRKFQNTDSLDVFND
jgi:dsDNA-specific endonuclease/ATPase MutS2